MNDDLKAQTRARIDEIDDLATRMADDDNAVRADLLDQIMARTELLRNVLGVALSGQEKPVSEPRTGTGQGIDDYIPLYDLPDEEIMARDGLPLVAVRAIKDGLLRAGKTLRYPPPVDHAKGWHVFKAGEPMPADWQERLKGGA